MNVVRSNIKYTSYIYKYFILITRSVFILDMQLWKIIIVILVEIMFIFWFSAVGFF